MIFQICLYTGRSEASNRLVGPGLNGLYHLLIKLLLLLLLFLLCEDIAIIIELLLNFIYFIYFLYIFSFHWEFRESSFLLLSITIKTTADDNLITYSQLEGRKTYKYGSVSSTWNFNDDCVLLRNFTYVF